MTDLGAMVFVLVLMTTGNGLTIAEQAALVKDRPRCVAAGEEWTSVRKDRAYFCLQVRERPQ